MGDALGIPVHGVGTHDAMAAGLLGKVLVVTDARRREVYWSLVVGRGPHARPRGRRARRAGRAPGDRPRARRPGRGRRGRTSSRAREAEVPGPTPAGLVAVAAPALRAGTTPAPLAPLYLRRPDAVPPGAPKTVTRA